MEVGGVELVWNAATTANVVFAAALGAFAVVIGMLSRLRGAGLWYALFGVSFALSTALGNITTGYVLALAEGGPGIADASTLTSKQQSWLLFLSWLDVPISIAWAWSVVRLVGCYSDHSMFRNMWALVVVAFHMLSRTWLASEFVGVPWSEPALAMPILGAESINALPTALMLGGAIVLAEAFRETKDTGAAIMAAALVVYPVVSHVGSAILITGVPWSAALFATTSLAVLVISAVWFQVQGNVGGRAPRRVAITTLGTFVVAAVVGVLWPYNALSGLARGFEILLVGYAILRLQYLGLDIKVRWGISKTTVAALFVAVFFVVSEGAAAVFSERFGSGIGIAAAGALVFGIAPIMRWADRFAEKAVPTVSDAESQFRRALQLVSSDGHISAAEDEDLARLAEELGLSAGAALRLRREGGP